MKFNKIIIWGWPIHSGTHSYIHEAFYKAFNFLGYKTFWFHDQNHPKNFDYNNALFISEGFADKEIPINSKSVYCVMYCPSPLKYQEAGLYIDLRMSAQNFKDHIHSYSIDRAKNRVNHEYCSVNKDLIPIGPGCFFEPKSTHSFIVKNDYVDYSIDDFHRLYLSWATNLLPIEFDFASINKERLRVVTYFGTISNQGINENMSNFIPFIDACNQEKIPFIHNDPWKNPISSREVIEGTQKSMLGIDIRGPLHVAQKISTCRIFKNVSYGHLGLTNSIQSYEDLEGLCFYSSDTAELLYQGLNLRYDKINIFRAMKLVQQKHTYLNRVQSIMDAVKLA